MMASGQRANAHHICTNWSDVQASRRLRASSSWSVALLSLRAVRDRGTITLRVNEEIEQHGSP
ncbi:hypothetical protein N9L68_02895 [bacterium]|nr:hypothetical protein [bacterium]